MQANQYHRRPRYGRISDPEATQDVIELVRELVEPLYGGLRKVLKRLEAVESATGFGKPVKAAMKKPRRPHARRASKNAIVEEQARRHHREYARVMGQNYLGMSENAFVQAVKAAGRRGDDRFRFLRDFPNGRPSLERLARDYWRDYRRTMGRDYMEGGEDAFVKAVVEAEREDTTGFLFLRRQVW